MLKPVPSVILFTRNSEIYYYGECEGYCVCYMMPPL